MKAIFPLTSLALMILAGCADEPGRGWGRLNGAVQAVFDIPDSRRLAGQEFKTSSSFAIELTELSVEVEAIEFFAATEAVAGDSTAAFDPANPPPGYSNCHTGHCHAADGSLPTYEEIEARLQSSSSAGAREIVSFPLEYTFDLLAGERIQLEPCVPTCEIAEQVTIGNVTLRIQAIRAGGVVRDTTPADRLLGAQRTWSISLPLDHIVGSDVALPVDASRSLCCCFYIRRHFSRMILWVKPNFFDDRPVSGIA